VRECDKLWIGGPAAGAETTTKNQYCETNVMHFLFNLLRINGLYMFQALLAHPQEELHNSTWYIACVFYQWEHFKPGAAN
jgi:hypothetical protein